MSELCWQIVQHQKSPIKYNIITILSTLSRFLRVSRKEGGGEGEGVGLPYETDGMHIILRRDVNYRFMSHVVSVQGTKPIFLAVMVSCRKSLDFIAFEGPWFKN